MANAYELLKNSESKNLLDLGFGDFQFLCISHIVAKNGEKWGPQSKVLANLSKEVRVKISQNPANPVNPATKTADVSNFFT